MFHFDSRTVEFYTVFTVWFLIYIYSLYFLVSTFVIQLWLHLVKRIQLIYINTCCWPCCYTTSIQKDVKSVWSEPQPEVTLLKCLPWGSRLEWKSLLSLLRCLSSHINACHCSRWVVWWETSTTDTHRLHSESAKSYHTVRRCLIKEPFIKAKLSRTTGSTKVPKT